MSIHFDYDPVTGLREVFDYDPIKDQVCIRTIEDVSPLLDRLKALRNDDDYSKQGIKGEWWHYATIPATVEIALRNKGLDIYDKNATAAIIKEINTNYPWLKATDKMHRIKE